MTILHIERNRRPVGMTEAVEMCNADVNSDGVVERLRDQIDNQNKMIARMLMVQFGQYQEEFSTPGFYPQTDADKLAFILGTGVFIATEE